MSNSEDFKRSADSARLITKLSVISGIGSLILLGVTLAITSGRGGHTLMVAMVPFVFALLFSAASFIYGLLATSSAQEDEEKLLLAKRMESRALNVEEDVRFTAGRSFANYCRFAPFALAVISALIMGALLWNLNGKLNGEFSAKLAEMHGSPIHTALIAAVMMMVCVFAGAFYVGQSRAPHFRWLRSVGAWLLMGFVSMLLVAVSAVCYANNLVKVDGVCSLVLFWIFAVLGAEFVISFIVEFYRPRSLVEVRPVFESQLLALFTEPGGVMRNIASALDYQFGFKVSGTWLYHFVERSFFPVLIAWAAVLWGFTTLHEIEANQIGIKETFGKRGSEVLQPGIYWTLPYPFGTVRRFNCDELQRIYIGESEKSADKRTATPVVLWTNQHGGADEPFVVAVSGNESANRRVVGSNAGDASISFVRMAIPIEYRIRKDQILLYAYENAQPVKVLQMIGEQVTAEYLAGATMDELMSHGRQQAEKTLKQRIQKLADANKLGLEIVRVGIMDAHPPVEKVAPAYQEVISALEQKETEILKAKAYAGSVLPEAEASAFEIVSGAKSYSERIKTVAAAEKDRFKAQLRAYLTMPRMFTLNAGLEVLEEDCKNIRKYVVSSGLQDEVYQINLETRERLDLIDVDAAELSNETAAKK